MPRASLLKAKDACPAGLNAKVSLGLHARLSIHCRAPCNVVTKNLQTGPSRWHPDAGPAKNGSAASPSPPSSIARTWARDGQHWWPKQQVPWFSEYTCSANFISKGFSFKVKKPLQRLIIKLHLFWGCWLKISSLIDPQNVFLHRPALSPIVIVDEQLCLLGYYRKNWFRSGSTVKLANHDVVFTVRQHVHDPSVCHVGVRWNLFIQRLWLLLSMCNRRGVLLLLLWGNSIVSILLLDSMWHVGGCHHLKQCGKKTCERPTILSFCSMDPRACGELNNCWSQHGPAKFLQLQDDPRKRVFSGFSKEH